MTPWKADLSPVGGGAPFASFPGGAPFAHHRITQVRKGLYLVDRGNAMLDVHKPGDVAQVTNLQPHHLRLVEDGVVLFDADLPEGHAWNASFAIRAADPEPIRTPKGLANDNLIPHYGSQGSKVKIGDIRFGGWPGPMLFDLLMTIYMPTTGERPDIGMITDVIAAWLMGASHLGMLAWANSAGSYCFHWHDPATGFAPSIIKYPGINAYDQEDRQGIAGKPSPYVMKGPKASNGYFTNGTKGTHQPAHWTEMLYVPTLAYEDPVFLLWLQRAAIWNMGQSCELSTPDGRRVQGGEYRGVGHSLGAIIKARAATADAIKRGYFVAGFNIPLEHFDELLANNLEYYNGHAKADLIGQRFNIAPGGYTRIGFWQHNYKTMNMLLGALTDAPGWREYAEFCLKNTIARFSGKTGWPPSYSSYYVDILRNDGTPAEDWAELLFNFFVSEHENEMTAQNHGQEYTPAISEPEYLKLVDDPMNAAGGFKMTGTVEYMMTDHAILEFASWCAKRGKITLPPDFAIARANCQKFFENYGACNARVAVRDSEDVSGWKATLLLGSAAPPTSDPSLPPPPQAYEGADEPAPDFADNLNRVYRTSKDTVFIDVTGLVPSGAHQLIADITGNGKTHAFLVWRELNHAAWLTMPPESQAPGLDMFVETHGSGDYLPLRGVAALTVNGAKIWQKPGSQQPQDPATPPTDAPDPDGPDDAPPQEEPSVSKLQPLADKVHETEGVIDSAITLITGLAQRLRDALTGEDLNAEVQALANELDAKSDALAAAVAANTPST